MKVKYYTDSKWFKPPPATDSPRLSLFTVPEREEEDWYEFQLMVHKEEQMAEQLAGMQDGGEWDVSSVAAMDGDGAHHRH